MNQEEIKDSIIALINKHFPFTKIEESSKGFEETLLLMFSDGAFVVDRERINILLSYWGLQPMDASFFEYYFKNTITNIEQLDNVFINFIKDGLWHFGDLKRAYLMLSKCDDIKKYISKHRFNVQELKDRLPWHLVELIEPSDRGFLGYVSGQRPLKEKELLGLAEIVLKEIEDNKSEYKGLSNTELSDKLLEKLSSTNPGLKDHVAALNNLKSEKNLDLFSAADIDKSKKQLDELKDQIDETLEKIKKLKTIGIKNQEHYLRNVESIDVYVATSMRNDVEYIDMHRFVEQTFNEENIKTLNLRYFDPTLCYCDSRIDKGIIECLLVRSTKVTIYCAQEGDTFGKDSELAATMSQGKPVIVYVPTAHEDDEEFTKISNLSERNKKYLSKQALLNSRANTFKEFHPLGLQVGLYDGVARGVIVVRSTEECSHALYKILTNTLEVVIKYEQNGIVLREKDTNSVIRGMTGWQVLSNCFWNQFSKTQQPKSGLRDN